uniref:Helicase/UvrB N-terminal domain-containing protein n=1 Tax=viral metagenome TaxID=1070528 RepID=A0A6C0EIR9_9ZZZZ
MDLFQSKLTKSEWESIEVPVDHNEKQILQMIVDGYDDLNISKNNTLSMLGYLKINYNENIEKYIFDKYFLSTIKEHNKKYDLLIDTHNQFDEKNKIKKADMMRLEQNNSNKIPKENIFEFILLQLTYKMLRYINKENVRWLYYYYTLYHIIKYPIYLTNQMVINYISTLLRKYEEKISIVDMIAKSYDYIEKNEYILNYSNMELYKHQKQIYSIFKTNIEIPKLVLYIAPTATGKTLTPLGLSKTYKVIFVCAARHVGIALAKSAISVGKKVAFGFGCNCTEDIRLHYFAAKEYTKDWRTGGIRKVDNTIGDKVEIMICDIQSYIYAMYYMISFNKKEKIITYWDEPTISMDYDEHSCHEVIRNNWSKNIIPNVVLSSATLPKEGEIVDVLQDFKCKFPGARIHSIQSDDCKKTIPIINTEGYVELPHYNYTNYSQILSCVEHCESYPTILRYFDLCEVSRFIVYIHENKLCNSERYNIENIFNSIDDVQMKIIKTHYLELLKHINPENWKSIYDYFQESRDYRIKPNNNDVKGIVKSASVDTPTIFNKGGGILKRTQSIQPQPSKPIYKNESSYMSPSQHGVFITTRDAYTLTSGPTIYLAEDTEKIAKFCLKQANIPAGVMSSINQSILFNNKINSKIHILDKNVEDALAKEEGKEHKISEGRYSDDVKRMMREIKELSDLIKPVNIDEMYIPNKIRHLSRWTGTNEYDIKPYTSDITDNDIEDIMKMNVDNIWKVLIIMGIGLFSQNVPNDYTEKVKELAVAQKLYIIIADEDFIYGTNYQFCHGYISKDLSMTQEKIIQSMGRIGRNKLQHQYSVRIRDNNMISKIFQKEENKKEVFNMNRLFQTNEDDIM